MAEFGTGVKFKNPLQLTQGWPMRFQRVVSLSAILLAPISANLRYSSAQEPSSAASSQSVTLDPEAEYHLAEKEFFAYPASPCATEDGLKHYLNSGNSGYAPSQKVLGAIFARAIRVTKDLPEAAHWYEMAAEQGDKESQAELGRLYEDGMGVQKNLAVAAYWYGMASQQGDRVAHGYLGRLTDIGVAPSAPKPDQLPPATSSFKPGAVESCLQKADAEKIPLAPGSEANRKVLSPISPSTIGAANRTCRASIAFAIANGTNVFPGVPDFAEKWIRKNGKDSPSLCFSQMPIAGAQNYVFVFSTSQGFASGFQPVVRTSTSTSTSPVNGSGTITSSDGGIWQYTYNGTVTTTTTTTNTQDVPFTLRESTLYLTIYNSSGSMVQQRWANDSRQIGGDPYQALGHNLGMALRNIHIKERLLKSGIKDVTGR